MILFSDLRYSVFCLSIGVFMYNIAMDSGGIIFSLHKVMFACFSVNVMPVFPR